MLDSNDVVTVSLWKDGKRFAYSITYDEGLIETAGFAWLIHTDYGIPGHINVFPEMLGKLVGDSSAGFLQSLWNLRKYAEPEQLQFLLSKEWTVGCQFSSEKKEHTADSLLQARLSLEKAVTSSVRTLAFDDFKACEANQHPAQEADFRWLFTLYDDLNAANENTHIIKRSPLYHRGPAPIRLANDPYRLLALARDQSGWVVDVVRLVDRYPLDPARDCTPAELETRFKAVRRIGEGGVWTASPETVAGYRALRLSTEIQDTISTPQQITYKLAVTNQDDPSTSGELTFVANLDSSWKSPVVTVGKEAVPLEPGPDPGTWVFTHQVTDGLQVQVVDGNRRSLA
jgi:hypothetical protein